jgi:hypothetical protein
MPKQRRRRITIVNVLSLATIVIVALLMLSRRLDGAGLALAAAPPSARRAAPLVDAGNAGEAPIASAATPASGRPVAPSVAAAASGAGSADGGATPIDLAVAPDGGVPRPAGATPYRSPFAKPNAGAPTRTKVGLLLNSVDDYDVKTGTFAADFFLSLTSDMPMPPVNLRFANGKVDDQEVLGDRPTFKLYRMRGTFKTPPDLRKYPFDHQDLKIIVDDDLLGIDQIRFSADRERTQLARGFRALGWQVSYVEARSLSQAYPERFDGDDLYYNRYIFKLGIQRFATSAAFKVFVPAFVIVIIALLGMWVPPDEMEVRSNSGAPMLAGAVLFHFALMQELPATSYLTRADKLMLGVYASLALGMLSTWWMFVVKTENMDRVFRVARVVVPVLTAIVMALACFI